MERKGSSAETPLKYSATRFKKFNRRLRSKCLANKYANHVLFGKDPVAKFLARNAAIKTELTTAGVAVPTAENVKDDPRKYTKEFLEALEARIVHGATAGGKLP